MNLARSSRLSQFSCASQTRSKIKSFKGLVIPAPYQKILSGSGSYWTNRGLIGAFFQADLRKIDQDYSIALSYQYSNDYKVKSKITLALTFIFFFLQHNADRACFLDLQNQYSSEMNDLYGQLKQINQQKHKFDSLLSDLQRATDKVIKKDLSQKQLHTQQSQIAHLFSQVKLVCQRNSETLQELKVNMMKAKNFQNKDVSNQQQLYENLVEYFANLSEKAKRFHTASAEKIQEIGKMKLIGNGAFDISDQNNHLDNSHRGAGEATEIAREVESSLLQQNFRLDSIRTKMGNLFGQINLSKTLTRMISTTSRQDYHLIIILTVLLVIEVIVCYFYIRPWVKGS